MKPKDPRKILQNCLPGVTIYDRSSQFHHTSDEHNESPPSYHYSYQSLHVVKQINPSPHFEWIPEQPKSSPRHQSLRPWCLGVVMIFMLFVTFYQSDSVSDATVVQVLQGDESTSNYTLVILHALERLDMELEGDIVLQSSKPKFVEASRRWRQGDMPPWIVIEAKTQHDVELAMPILVGMVRDYNLDFAVRSGGYSPFSSTKGVLLSLSQLQSLEWNNQSTVVMEPGVQMEIFQRKILDEKGYTSIVADAAHIGLGGFVLGGGYGLLSRKYGLAIDNVVRLRVVLIDGYVKDVYRGDDLFWACLGSGGTNFGIVTEMEYKVHKTTDMKLAATVRLSIQEALGFLQRIGDMESTLDRNVTIRMSGLQHQKLNHSIPSSHTRGNYTWQEESTLWDGMTEIMIYWMGDCEPDHPLGMEYLKDHVIPLLPTRSAESLWFYYFSWSALSRAKDQPKSWSTIWAAESWNGFLYADENLSKTWHDIQQSFSILLQNTQFVTPTIELWGGAIADVPYNATAFPHRQSLYHVRIDLMVPKDDFTTSTEAQSVYEEELAHVSVVWPSISKHLKGVFVNYPMPQLSQDQFPTAYWGDNLERLVTLKHQFDPFHLLHYDQGVPFLLD